MREKLTLLISIGLLFLSPSAVFAHVGDSGEGVLGVLAHFLTGADHLPMLIFVGIGVAYFVWKQRKQSE